MTRGFRALLLPGTISIHALHEESDRHVLGHAVARFDFNPRSP